MRKLSERLKAAMLATGFKTQNELAKASGIEQPSISKILRGVSETSKASGNLAQAMGVNADWLITGRGQMFDDSLPKEKMDASKFVDLHTATGFTGEKIQWFRAVSKDCAAFKIPKKTGIKQIPDNSIVIVDKKTTPSNGDIILTNIQGEISAARYLSGASSLGFLAVDDERIPLSEIKDPSIIVGVIREVYIPGLL